MSTDWSAGSFLDRLEREFGDIHGASGRCIAVSNGTTALHLCLLTLDLRPEDEVVITGWGFAAAANMVRMIGARPVFCDVDAESWVATAETIEPLIGARTKAVVVIHNYGVLSPLAPIQRLLQERGIILIEDCAEALFSRYDGGMAGCFGDLSTWSFQSTKTISCGEGGMVLAKSAAQLERMRLIRSHGMKSHPKYVHWELGHNFRLTNIQAAVAFAQLEKRDTIIENRRRIYDFYRAALADLPLQFQGVPAGVDPVFWGLGVRLAPGVRKSRAAVMAELAAAGIETRPGFVAFSAQPIYQADALPVSDELSASVFSLPYPADLNRQEIEHIVRALRAVLS